MPSSVHGSVAVSGRSSSTCRPCAARCSPWTPKTGKLKWRHDPEAAPEGNNQRTYGYYGVTVADGKVLFPYQTRFGEAATGMLLALDAKTGQRIWAAPMTGATMSDGTPAVSDGRVYVGNETADRRDRVRPEDRREALDRARRPSAAGRTASRPRPTAKVFIGSNNGIVARDGATGATSVDLHQLALVAGEQRRDPVRRGDQGQHRVHVLPERRGHRAERVRPAPSSGTSCCRVRSTGVGPSPRRRCPATRCSSAPTAVGSTRSTPRTGQPLLVSMTSAPGCRRVRRSAATPSSSGALDGNLYAFTPGGTAAAPWPLVAGKVTNKTTGAPAAEQHRQLIVQDGTAIGRTSTDAAGNYRVGLPRRVHTLQVALATSTAATARGSPPARQHRSLPVPWHRDQRPHPHHHHSSTCTGRHGREPSSDRRARSNHACPDRSSTGEQTPATDSYGREPTGVTRAPRPQFSPPRRRSPTRLVRR